MQSGSLLKKFILRLPRLLPFLFLSLIIFTIGYILGAIQNSGLCIEKWEVIRTTSKNHIDVTATYVSYLVVIIFSSPKNRDRRNTIRKTWLTQKGNHKILHYFVIGTASLRSQDTYLLQNEEEVNNDLMLLSSVADSYSLLSLKLIEAFHWINEHVKFTFLLKVDDDTFVRLNQLHELSVKKPQSKLYWGFFDGRAKVKRAGKWEERKWFLCDNYLPYTKGGGYVLSSDLVQYVVQNSKLLSMYKNEDVSLGVWLAPLEINRTHDLRFDTEFRSQGCDNSFIITHKQSTSLMEEKHTHLTATGKLCPYEFRNTLTYEYNWHALPSKCCVRNVSAIVQDRSKKFH